MKKSKVKFLSSIIFAFIKVNFLVHPTLTLLKPFRNFPTSKFTLYKLKLTFLSLRILTFTRNFTSALHRISNVHSYLAYLWFPPFVSDCCWALKRQWYVTNLKFLSSFLHVTYASLANFGTLTAIDFQEMQTCISGLQAVWNELQLFLIGPVPSFSNSRASLGETGLN